VRLKPEPKGLTKNMKNPTPNLDLQDSLCSNKKPTENTKSEALPKEILDKIKLIEKAFK
jgi:hypothetical protein